MGTRIKMNLHERYRQLDKLSKDMLKCKLEKVGGKYDFGEDTPIVIACPYYYPEYYAILEAFINDKEQVCMVGREIDGFEHINISCDDIEGSHIPYIFDYID